jgi:hypothetical protein
MTSQYQIDETFCNFGFTVFSYTICMYINYLRTNFIFIVISNIKYFDFMLVFSLTMHGIRARKK